jgi:L-aspartate semialdehyde sulfurtransferase ferredoxin
MVSDKQRVKFTFVQELIKEPIIWKLAKQFDIVTNIRRADVTSDHGWVVLEMEGDEVTLDRGIAWLKDKGVKVDPIESDVIIP